MGVTIKLVGPPPSIWILGGGKSIADTILSNYSLIIFTSAAFSDAAYFDNYTEYYKHTHSYSRTSEFQNVKIYA